jgi:hypothetical protein
LSTRDDGTQFPHVERLSKVAVATSFENGVAAHSRQVDDVASARKLRTSDGVSRTDPHARGEGG